MCCRLARSPILEITCYCYSCVCRCRWSIVSTIVLLNCRGDKQVHHVRLKYEPESGVLLMGNTPFENGLCELVEHCRTHTIYSSVPKLRYPIRENVSAQRDIPWRIGVLRVCFSLKYHSETDGSILNTNCQMCNLWRLLILAGHCSMNLTNVELHCCAPWHACTHICKIICYCCSGHWLDTPYDVT